MAAKTILCSLLFDTQSVIAVTLVIPGTEAGCIFYLELDTDSIKPWFISLNIQ